jgi:hypothetical protein
MKKYLLLLLALALLVAPVASQAAQFAIFGPRALGMGGASVAAVNDSTAVYWNPAALANSRKIDIRLSAGAAARDYAGLNTKWSDISDIYSAGLSGNPAAVAQLQQLLLELDKPDSVTTLDVTGGLLLSIPFSRSAIAISALGVGYAEIIPTIDTVNLNTNLAATDSIANNNSAATGIGLVSEEPAVSLATSLLGEHLLIGANAKMIYASTFIHTDYLRTGDFNTFLDNLNNSETKSNKASFDAGILIKPTSGLSLGVVGRYLNSPSFPINGTVAEKTTGPQGVIAQSVSGEIELKPQYRAGVAWMPIDNLTLTADYDLSKNKSFIERTEDQIVAGGAELTLWKETLSLRAGAYKNTANTNANVVYTAGLGLRLFAFRLDLAGAYDFKEQEAQASTSLAFTF